MKNKLLYFLINIAVFLFFVFFFAFLIIAFVVREQGSDFIVLFYLAGISAFFGIISLIMYAKITKSKWYKEVVELIRLEKFEKAKSKKLKEYGFEVSSSINHLELTLRCFQSAELSNGKIFFREGINIYNKKEPSIDVFYLPKELINSFDMGTEKSRIKLIAEDIDAFFKSRKLSINFLNCVVLFYQDAIEEREKDFYYNCSAFNILFFHMRMQ